MFALPADATAELDGVIQLVYSTQQFVGESCRLPYDPYKVSALGRAILYAAGLHPVAAGQAERLAAATELLLLGHRTHRQLTAPARLESAPSALVLGGDALLAQAAVFAAAVENVAVMQTFSRMLMILSEAALRLSLEPSSGEAEPTLWTRVYANGLQAAGQLCGATCDELTALRAYGQGLETLAAAVTDPPAEASRPAAGALMALTPLAMGEANYQLRALVMELADGPTC